MSEIEIKQLVSLLRIPPFSLNFSLVDFSHQSPSDLHQLFSDVFAILDSNFPAKKVKDEDSQATATRLLSFLVILGYKFAIDPAYSESFGINFMKGDVDTIYPCLLWILTRVELLKKRCYLSHFLRPFDIPEDLFADGTIVNLAQKYKIHQGEFRDIHKQVEKNRAEGKNPQSLQKELQQIENEREQLNNKLSKLNGKISVLNYDENEFQEMLVATNTLRQEQEEEGKLYDKMLEQKSHLQRAEQMRQMMGKKYQELNSTDLMKIDPLKLLIKFRNEVSDRRNYCENKLEEMIIDREKQLKSLNKLLHGDVTHLMDEPTVNELDHQYKILQGEVSQLEGKLQNDSNNKNDSQIAFLRDRFNGAEKKKETFQENINELLEDKTAIEEEIKRYNDELKSFLLSQSTMNESMPNRPKNEAEHKKYMSELSSKTTQYKSLKNELEYEKEENRVLEGTVAILKSQIKNLQHENESLEKKKGIAGYMATEETLASVSSLKAEIDQTKGETLDDISTLVEKINGMLKERKNNLAPLIKELRAVRSTYEELESSYMEKKRKYDGMRYQYESEKNKMEVDVNEWEKTVQEEESSYHFLQKLLLIAETRMIQCVSEQKYERNEEKFPLTGFRSYRDYLEKEIGREEMKGKQLRNEKKYLNEKIEKDIGQRGRFGVLRDILKKKLELMNRRGEEGGEGDRENGVVMMNSGGGALQDLGEAERMVFD